MNNFSRMTMQLDLFKDSADTIFKNFHDEDEASRQRYLPEVYKVEHEKLVEKYRAMLDSEREKKIKILNDLLDEMQTTLKVWTTRPIRNEAALNTIMKMRELGLKFSAAEIESYSEILSDSYAGQKILNQLAQENGIKLSGKFTGLESYTQALKSAKNEAEIFTTYYCGRRAEGKELLAPEYQKSFLIGAAATVKFSKHDSQILAAAAIFSDGRIPVHERRARWSADDAEILNKMLEGCNSHAEKQNRVAELVHENPDLVSFIQLSPERDLLPKDDN